MRCWARKKSFEEYAVLRVLLRPTKQAGPLHAHHYIRQPIDQASPFRFRRYRAREGEKEREEAFSLRLRRASSSEYYDMNAISSDVQGRPRPCPNAKDVDEGSASTK